MKPPPTRSAEPSITSNPSPALPPTETTETETTNHLAPATEIATETEKELDAIKEQYFGSKKRLGNISRDMNSLYQNPHEALLLFGRGFLAGIDRREKESRDEIRRKEGRPEEAAAQKQKEEGADMYDAFDMRVDRHRSEKKLEEMTERDWRIFREDFNISYKGSKLPRPMRNWAESRLGNELLNRSRRPGRNSARPSPEGCYRSCRNRVRKDRSFRAPDAYLYYSPPSDDRRERGRGPVCCRHGPHQRVSAADRGRDGEIHALFGD